MEPTYREYPYPETTPGSINNGKYWHQLSEQNQEALNAVEKWVQDEQIDLSQLGTADLHFSLLLLRYLRANRFDATKTIAHIQKNIEWRKTMNVSEIISQSPEKILGCTLEELTNVFPHWHSGYDKTGRPVIYKQYGKFDAGQIKKLVGGKNFDNVTKYHIWEQEACGRLCLAKSIADKKIVETITGVVDIKDMGMSQITSDFLNLTKAIAAIDQNQYPETMGRVFIINAPAAFPLVWRMVKPWLDPATVAKIQVLGGPKEHIPVLVDFIGEENLPSNYGGTLPPLSPLVHPYAETMIAYPKEEEAAASPVLPAPLELFDPAVLAFPYPDSTPGSQPNNGKYYTQLTPQSQEALTAVEQWVAKEKVDLRHLSNTDLHPALLLLRYLRANQFNPTKAIAHIQRNLEWRKTKDIDALILQRPEDILGCSLEELTAVFPHWHSGYDKTGRPVLYKQYGKFDAATVKKLCGGNFDSVSRYHLWEQEACGRLCIAQSKKSGQIVETITGVIDIKDMGLSQITSDFLKLVKSIAEIDQNQYPETLGRCFIINAPSMFPMVWRMVKPWLDPATVAKIQVLGGPKEHIPVLVDFIGEENLPSNYGGTLPPLSPQVHPYAETMSLYPTIAPTIPAEPVAAVFDPEVLTYPYPEGATSNNGKHWLELSPASQTALTAVEQWVAKDKVDLKKLGTADIHPSLQLLRYLRANQFNPTKAIAHIQRNLEWRKTKDIDALILQRPEDILGCSLEELTAVFPHWHSGYDKSGRPVLYKQYGKFDAGTVKKLVGGDFGSVVKYHVWEQEACGRLCLAQTKKLKRIVETVTGVIDIKDMGMSQITRDFLSLTKLLAEIDQNQYPETLGRCFIINAPAAFPLVWRMVKPWLDPATVAKIQVLGGPKEHIPVLVDFIGEENLPSNYGGTLPPLSPQVHPYAETMWSYSSSLTTAVDVEARAAYDRVNDRNSLRQRPTSQRRRSLRISREEAPVEPSSLMYYPTLLWNGIRQNWFFDESPTDDNESEWDGSQHSDDSDELHFEDAFETQSDLETNSHSHLYSARPEDGTSTQTKRKKKHRTRYLKRILLFKSFHRCYRAVVWDKKLRSLTIQRLEMRYLIASAIHLLCTMVVAAISSTALDSISWTSVGARLQLWAYTLVLLVSCFMIIFDIAGYYAVQTKNWPLLVMYCSGVLVGSLLFLSATIACFVYYSLPESTGTSSLNSTLAENRSFMVTIALGTLIVFLIGISPLIYARGVIIKLREAQGKVLQTRQIQIVLKVAQSVSVLAAIAMLIYGGLGLELLLSIHYAAAIFAIYGMEYGGVSVLITSTIGVWASNTVHRSVLRIYEYIVLPFIIALLLIVGVIAFSTLYDTEKEVHNAYPDLDTTLTEEELKATVQSFLLVTGMLSVVLCVFQTISLVATSSLRSTIDSNGQVKEKLAILQAIKEKELGIFSSGGIVNGEEVVNKDTYWSDFSVEHLGRLYMLYSRNQRDRFLIAWGIFGGLFNIFVNGSLAVFARHADESQLKGSWMFALLNYLGRADSRFIESDPFIRSSMTILAAIVGPLMLFYAWTTFVYAPYRFALLFLNTLFVQFCYLLFNFCSSCSVQTCDGRSGHHLPDAYLGALHSY